MRASKALSPPGPADSDPLVPAGACPSVPAVTAEALARTVSSIRCRNACTSAPSLNKCSVISPDSWIILAARPVSALKGTTISKAPFPPLAVMDGFRNPEGIKATAARFSTRLLHRPYPCPFPCIGIHPGWRRGDNRRPGRCPVPWTGCKASFLSVRRQPLNVLREMKTTACMVGKTRTAPSKGDGEKNQER